MYSNLYAIHTYIHTHMRDVPRRKRERIREGRRRRRSARKTIDKSVSTARIPIASSYAARLTRCLYRGMYNNRLRRWHRCPFVSVGGHLGFSSREDKRAGPRKGGEGEEGTRRGTVGWTVRKVRERSGGKDSDVYAIGERIGKVMLQ